MPTKLPRLSVTFPVSLYETIKKDSELNRRSESNQVIWVLDQYYAERRKEADLFTPTRLREAGPAPRAPIYVQPDQPRSEPSLKPREIEGLGKS